MRPFSNVLPFLCQRPAPGHRRSTAFRYLFRYALVGLMGLGIAPQAFSQSFSLPNDQWELLVLPADPQGALISDMFGDDLAMEDFASTWIIYGYDNASGEYDELGPDNTIEAGRAFWIIQRTNAEVVLDLPAGLAPPAGSTVGACGSTPCFGKQLTQALPAGSTSAASFNLVGSPYAVDTPLSQVRFTATSAQNGCAGGCSLDEAVSEGNVGLPIFTYDSSTGDYATLGSGDNLSPWQGFWLGVFANQPSGTQTIFFPSEAGNTTCSGATSPEDDCPTGALPDLSQYDEVFADEFSGSELDGSLWNTGLLWGPYVPINNEEQLYVDTLGMHQNPAYDPFTLTGNSLQITAAAVGPDVQVPPRPAEDDPVWRSILEYRYNGPTENNPGYQEANVNYLSGIITSNESFRMTHGYAEARVKLPGGRGLWPAFWLLNSHYVQYSPEIDIMEFLGQDRDVLYNTYHYFDFKNGFQRNSTPSFVTRLDDWTADFHTYGVEWTPREIIWYIDGAESYRIDDETLVDPNNPARGTFQIANQAMYLLANLAVGGTWPGAPDESTEFPATYEIDYIRAYEKKSADPLDLERDYQIMFEDTFTGASLDADKWTTHQTWGPWFSINDEQQYYIDVNGVDAGAADSPFSFANDRLTISANESPPLPALPPASAPAEGAAVWTANRLFRQPTNYTRANYTSGLITSYDAFKFAEGYVEIRAQIPEGAGIRPVFKLYHGYSVARLPEINIMEAAGADTSKVLHNYIRSGTNGQRSRDVYETSAPSGKFSDDFHTYGVRWQPGKLTWYVDGVPVHTLTDPSVAYQIMYVIASLSVGDNLDPTADLGTVEFPVDYVIDYIRIYQQK